MPEVAKRTVSALAFGAIGLVLFFTLWMLGGFIVNHLKLIVGVGFGITLLAAIIALVRR